ncbi:MAG: hypothetical protein RRY29_07725 [Desulfovibrionaceae bacterium]
MKKVLLVCLLVLGMAGSAWAEGAQLLGLKKDAAFIFLEKISDETEFLFDAEDAKISCDAVCVASQIVGQGTHIMITYDKDTDAVRDMTMLVQVSAKSQGEVLQNMQRCAEALGVFARAIYPQVKKSDIKKLQKKVGIMSDGLIEGKRRTTVYKNVTLSANFIEGVYFLSMSSSKDTQGKKK